MAPGNRLDRQLEGGRRTSNGDSASAMIKLAVGEVVQGYRICRYLGRGGFASVYQAVDEDIQEVLGPDIRLVDSAEATALEAVAR